MANKSENMVQWVYAAQNDHELEERYDEWAKTYDGDLENDFGWAGPQRAVAHFTKYVSQDAHILDVGAGTGLVGELLTQQGYTDIGALDLSAGMLEEAKKKGVYQAFYQMNMMAPLDFDSNAFDAVIGSGVFTVGHVGPQALDELVRITKPGGYIAYTLRPDTLVEAGFDTKHAALEAAQKWKPREVSQEYKIMPKGEPEVVHQVWVFEVTA